MEKTRWKRVWRWRWKTLEEKVWSQSLLRNLPTILFSIWFCKFIEQRKVRYASDAELIVASWLGAEGWNLLLSLRSHRFCGASVKATGWMRTGRSGKPEREVWHLQASFLMFLLTSRWKLPHRTDGTRRYISKYGILGAYHLVLEFPWYRLYSSIRASFTDKGRMRAYCHSSYCFRTAA